MISCPTKKLIKQSYQAIDIEKGYLLLYQNSHMVEYWAPYGKYNVLVDMPCFQHGKAKILKLFKMAIQSQKILRGWSKLLNPLSDSCLGTMCTLNGVKQTYASKHNGCYFEPIFELSSDFQECFGHFLGASHFFQIWMFLHKLLVILYLLESDKSCECQLR